jgi:hypothetical protein
MESPDMNMRRTILLVAIASAVAMPPLTAQVQPNSGDASKAALPPASTTHAQSVMRYTRPTQRTKLNNYLFDSFGPYPIVSAAFEAGIDQAGNSPPDWRQGAQGYGKRFGSEFGMATVSTTTRYALGEAFREDTLYYRCECRGFFPRLNTPCFQPSFHAAATMAIASFHSPRWSDRMWAP